MKTENLIVNQGGKRQVVEQVCEVFPDIGIAVLAEALVVKAIHLGDLARLVVTTEDGNALGVSDFESDQEGHSLNGKVASIDIVSYKESVYIARADARNAPMKR